MVSVRFNHLQWRLALAALSTCVWVPLSLAEPAPKPAPKPEAKPEPKPVPSNTPDDVFGFLDDSTVLNAGTRKLKYVFLPSSGGGSATWTQKLALNYGATDNLEIGLAVAYQPTISTLPGESTRQLSVQAPMQYVLVQRMQNGTGFALITTPSIGTSRAAGQPSASNWTLDNHFALDHDFDGRYFIGLNVGYTAGATDWRQSPSGTFYIQGAATAKLNPYLYWGVEVQASQQMNGFFSGNAGWATFAGTSISVPMSAQVTFSAAYMRQIAGRETANPSANLNTQNFSQNLGKVALAIYF